jgi:cytochrome c oxidase subunit II
MRSEVTIPKALTKGRARRLTTPVLVGTGLLLAGCAKDAPQDIFQPEGPNAKTIDNLQRPVFYIAGAMLIVVTGIVLYAARKFRDQGQPIPDQGHGKSAIELGGILISAAILAGVAVPTFATIFKLNNTKNCDFTVNVTGQQWWWEYSYPVQPGIPEPIVTSGELVLPAGECVKLRLTSRDVIHSFWIPKLNGKRDAVPGRIHIWKMEADQPGIYDGQCTEFCGLSHANMKMNVAALNAADFATWVAGQATDAAVPPASDEAALRGKETFGQCSRCHQMNGLVDNDGNPVINQADQNLVSGAAPNLTHLMSRTTFAGATYDLLTQECRDALRSAPPEEFGALYLKGVTPECLNRAELEEWLSNAPAKKAMYPDVNDKGLGRGMPYLGLSTDQVDDLVAYLLTLNPQSGAN